MANPYKIYEKNQGPKWLDGLQKYVVPPDHQEDKTRDATVTARNHDSDPEQTQLAAYGKFRNGKK